jgi:hypothetical protein
LYCTCRVRCVRCAMRVMRVMCEAVLVPLDVLTCSVNASATCCSLGCSAAADASSTAPRRSLGQNSDDNTCRRHVTLLCATCDLPHLARHGHGSGHATTSRVDLRVQTTAVLGSAVCHVHGSIPSLSSDEQIDTCMSLIMTSHMLNACSPKRTFNNSTCQASDCRR